MTLGPVGVVMVVGVTTGRLDVCVMLTNHVGMTTGVQVFFNPNGVM